MNTDRSANISIGGKDYELILTTAATKAISKRYGGLENLGDKLSETEHFEDALSEIVWLITLLANQSVLIWNFKNPNERKDLLTEDTVELLTTPFELAEYKDAIMTAMYKGSKRYVLSEEENLKNTKAE